MHDSSVGSLDLVTEPDLIRAIVHLTPLGDLFANLAPETQQALTNIANLCEFKTGQILIADATMAEHVGYVLEGVLAMRKTIDDGRSHIIGLLMPTDTYGRVFYGQSSFQVEALIDTQVLCFEREAFERILLQNPVVERQFMLHMLDELDAMREWIVMLGARQVITRLASFLLILSRRVVRQSAMNTKTNDAPLLISVPMRRMNLAEYLGTSAESLSRAIHVLKRAGIIAIKGPFGFEILDYARLVAKAGQDGLG